jgi:hypothetical protein
VLAALPAVLIGPIRNDAPFPEFCVEAENGFLRQEIVSSHPSNETAAGKYQ